MNNPMHPPPYSLAQCIERLGPVARAKYADLKDLVGDAEALQRSLMERIEATQEASHRLQHRLAGATLPTGDPDEAKQLAADLAGVSSKLDRLERERSRRNSVAANTGQVL